MGVINKYQLLKPMPGLNAGAIFEHREYDPKYPNRGNVANGCMILAWLDGNCQDDWCGESFVLPGQLANYTEWFELISEPYIKFPVYKKFVTTELIVLFTNYNSGIVINEGAGSTAKVGQYYNSSLVRCDDEYYWNDVTIRFENNGRVRNSSD